MWGFTLGGALEIHATMHTLLYIIGFFGVVSQPLEQ